MQRKDNSNAMAAAAAAASAASAPIIDNTHLPKPVLMKIDEEASISVKISGVPAPNTRWQIGRKRIKESSKYHMKIDGLTHTLVIARVASDVEQGVWVVASNQHGEDCCMIEVKTYSMLTGQRATIGRNGVESQDTNQGDDSKLPRSSSGVKKKKRRSTSHDTHSVMSLDTWQTEMDQRNRMRSVDDIMNNSIDRQSAYSECIVRQDRTKPGEHISRRPLQREGSQRDKRYSSTEAVQNELPDSAAPPLSMDDSSFASASSIPGTPYKERKLPGLDDSDPPKKTKVKKSRRSRSASLTDQARDNDEKPRRPRGAPASSSNSATGQDAAGQDREKQKPPKPPKVPTNESEVKEEKRKKKRLRERPSSRSSVLSGNSLDRSADDLEEQKHPPDFVQVDQNLVDQQDVTEDTTTPIAKQETPPEIKDETSPTKMDEGEKKEQFSKIDSLTYVKDDNNNDIWGLFGMKLDVLCHYLLTGSKDVEAKTVPSYHETHISDAIDADKSSAVDMLILKLNETVNGTDNAILIPGNKENHPTQISAEEVHKKPPTSKKKKQKGSKLHLVASSTEELDKSGDIDTNVDSVDFISNSASRNEENKADEMSTKENQPSSAAVKPIKIVFNFPQKQDGPVNDKQKRTNTENEWDQHGATELTNEAQAPPTDHNKTRNDRSSRPTQNAGVTQTTLQTDRSAIDDERYSTQTSSMPQVYMESHIGHNKTEERRNKPQDAELHLTSAAATSDDKHWVSKEFEDISSETTRPSWHGNNRISLKPARSVECLVSRTKSDSWKRGGEHPFGGRLRVARSFDRLTCESDSGLPLIKRRSLSKEWQVVTTTTREEIVFVQKGPDNVTQQDSGGLSVQDDVTSAVANKPPNSQEIKYIDSEDSMDDFAWPSPPPTPISSPPQVTSTQFLVSRTMDNMVPPATNHFVDKNDVDVDTKNKPRLNFDSTFANQRSYPRIETGIRNRIEALSLYGYKDRTSKTGDRKNSEEERKNSKDESEVDGALAVNDRNSMEEGRISFKVEPEVDGVPPPINMASFPEQINGPSGYDSDQENDTTNPQNKTKDRPFVSTAEFIISPIRTPEIRRSSSITKLVNKTVSWADDDNVFADKSNWTRQQNTEIQSISQDICTQTDDMKDVFIPPTSILKPPAVIKPTVYANDGIDNSKFQLVADSYRKVEKRDERISDRSSEDSYYVVDNQNSISPVVVHEYGELLSFCKKGNSVSEAEENIQKTQQQKLEILRRLESLWSSNNRLYQRSTDAVQSERRITTSLTEDLSSKSRTALSASLKRLPCNAMKVRPPSPKREQLTSVDLDLSEFSVTENSLQKRPFSDSTV